MYYDFDLLSLTGSAGNDQANDPDDIAALDSALRRIGVYEPPKGGSYADLTIEVDKSVIHISFYRAKAGGSPKPIEIEQAERLAYNTRPANVVIMIQNKYGREAINQAALERFLNGVIDAVRAGAGRDSMSVRDPQVRERIIRHFNAYKPN